MVGFFLGQPNLKTYYLFEALIPFESRNRNANQWMRHPKFRCARPRCGILNFAALGLVCGILNFAALGLVCGILNFAALGLVAAS